MAPLLQLFPSASRRRLFLSSASSLYDSIIAIGIVCCFASSAILWNVHARIVTDLEVAPAGEGEAFTSFVLPELPPGRKIGIGSFSDQKQLSSVGEVMKDDEKIGDDGDDDKKSIGKRENYLDLQDEGKGEDAEGGISTPPTASATSEAPSSSIVKDAPLGIVEKEREKPADREAVEEKGKVEGETGVGFVDVEDGSRSYPDSGRNVGVEQLLEETGRVGAEYYDDEWQPASDAEKENEFLEERVTASKNSFEKMSKRKKRKWWSEMVGERIACDPGVATGFLFLVNRTSGNREGERFLKKRKFHDYLHCNFAWFFQPFERKAFVLLRRLIRVSKFIGESRGEQHDFFIPRVVAVGGDGTVGWTIDQLFNHHIDVDSIVLAAIGFGTGNDFFRAYQLPRLFSGVRLRDRMKRDTMRDALYRLKKARFRRHDILETAAEVEPGGSIHQVTGSKKDINVLKKGQLKMVKRMNNYFSSGILARIGQSFDKFRTKMRLTNLFVYGAVYAKKTISPVERVNKYINALYAGDRQVFSCGRPGSLTRTLESSVSLMLMNINSMMGGIDVWGGASKVGLEPPNWDEDSLLLEKRQHMGDGVVEWMNLNNMFSIFAVKSTKSGAGRVFQGAPPFTLEFKKDYTKPIFFQIDGENYRANKLNRIKIRLKAKIWVATLEGPKAARLREKIRDAKSELYG